MKHEGDTIALVATVWILVVTVWLITLTQPTSSELKEIYKEVKCEVSK